MKDTNRVIYNQELLFKILGSENSSKTTLQHTTRLVFIVGQSGCGKDTFCENILPWLISSEKKNAVVQSTGAIIRSMNKDSKSPIIARLHELNNQAERQNPLLPLMILGPWLLNEAYKTGEEIVIINGAPRAFLELSNWILLVHAGYLPITDIIEIDVPDDECRKRLLGREDGRLDSRDENLERKLAWYQDIRSMFEAYNQTGLFKTYSRLHKIDGTGTIEEVFERGKEIFSKKIL